MVVVKCPEDDTPLGDFEAHDTEYYEKTKRFYSKLCPKCSKVWFFRVYTDGKVRVESTTTAILHERR